MPPIDDPFGTPAGGGNGSPPDDRTMIMQIGRAHV